VDGTYLGEPLISLSGTIRIPEGVEVDPEGSIFIAAYWPNGDEGQIFDAQSIVQTEFPARYSMSLFQPPRDVSYYPVEEGRVVEGFIVVINDLDEDGIWERDAGEPIVGVAQDYKLYFAPDGGRTDGVELSEGLGLILIEECDDARNDDERPQIFLPRGEGTDSVDLVLIEPDPFFAPATRCDGGGEHVCIGNFHEAVDSRASPSQFELFLGEGERCMEDFYFKEIGYGEQCGKFIDTLLDAFVVMEETDSEEVGFAIEAHLGPLFAHYDGCFSSDWENPGRVCAPQSKGYQDALQSPNLLAEEPEVYDSALEDLQTEFDFLSECLVEYLESEDSREFGLID